MEIYKNEYGEESVKYELLADLSLLYFALGDYKNARLLIKQAIKQRNEYYYNRPLEFLVLALILGILL